MILKTIRLKFLDRPVKLSVKNYIKKENKKIEKLN